MTFYVGQKVVCIKGINSVGRSGHGWEVCPKTGIVYTIRGFFETGDGLFLEEIVNRPALYEAGIHEFFFRSFRFRPLDERPTDISTFTEMLTPKKASIDA